MQRRYAAVSSLTDMSPDLRLTVQMVLAARRWRALLDERLRPLGHSASRMEAMATIANSPTCTPQIEIAKRIGIEGPTLTRILDMLERDGLVQRLADPSDRRSKHIRLTSAGEDALDEILAVVGALRGQLLDSLDPAAIDGTNVLLAQILDRLAAGLPDEPPA